MAKHKDKEVKTNAMRILDKNKIFMKQLIMSAMNLSMGFIPQKRPVHQWNSLLKLW